MSNNKILLIDDQETMLKNLEMSLKNMAHGDDVGIITWQPKVPDDVIENFSRNSTAEMLFDELYRKITKIKPTLVVTDYDLTEQGYLGLIGPTITRWCQKEFFPVIEFSREFESQLPTNPNLFRLQAPINNQEQNKIIPIYHGFKQIMEIIKDIKIKKYSSYSILLYDILKNICYEHELYQYFDGLEKNIDFLYENTKIREKKLTIQELNRLVTYVLGHVLINTILRFPGPIMSEKALCAYVAVDYSEMEKLKELFRNARYDGPFHEIENFYWKTQVDEIIENKIKKIYKKINNNIKYSSFQYRNIAVKYAINKNVKLTEHKCENCGSKRGGYFCPFTETSVCDSDYCSVSSSSWIPQGASICRVNKNYFDKYSPLLG